MGKVFGGIAGGALPLDPNAGLDYANLCFAYVTLNRLDDAEAVYKQVEERKLEQEFLVQSRYWLAFLKGDMVQMAQLVSAAMGKAGSEDLLLAAQADTEGWYGKLKSAHELTHRAMDSALHNDAKEAAAAYQAAAEKLAAQLDKTFPLNTLVQRYWLPTIRAAVALEHKNPNRAIELLSPASTTELGEPTATLAVFLCPVYLRGESYLMLHDGGAAAAEFQKFIDHRGLVVNFPWGALARLGLARAYTMQGDTAKAKPAYQDFLTLWKDADPDIPILKQAKAEYAKLR